MAYKGTDLDLQALRRASRPPETPGLTERTGNTLNGADCQANSILTDPRTKFVYLENGGIFNVSKVTVRPDFDFGVKGDVALLKLQTPVTGIAPSPINTTGHPPVGSPGTIVGFGLSGPNASFDVGIKRAGNVVTSACTIVPASTHVCWTYKSPIGVPGTNSDTCAGDSGGPLFNDLGSGSVLTGVTSGGDTNCDPTDHSFDADVFTYHDWIAQQSNGDLGTASCGGLPAAGGPGATVFAGSGTLNSAAPRQRFTVNVPVDTDRLRVALNTEPDADFDLFIKQGGTATPTNFDCKGDSASSLEFCEVRSPAPGTWSLLAQRASGNGGFQLTATIYALTKVTPTPCIPSSTALCLNGGRFKVEATWKTADGATGAAHTVPLTTDSGYLWFFNPDNVELVVKVLNGCALGNHFWVFAGGLTNVQTTITVTDSQTGVVRIYLNAQDTPFQPLQDTLAFTCP